MLQDAFAMGDADATYALATWHLFGQPPYIAKNPKEAVRLFKIAASGGASDAMYDLAVSYEVGTGIERNLRRAFQNYVRAALHGNSKAIYEVGRCLYYGIGVAKDRVTAGIWLDRSRKIKSLASDKKMQKQVKPSRRVGIAKKPALNSRGK